MRKLINIKLLKYSLIAFVSIVSLVFAQIIWAVDIDLSLTVNEGTLFIDVVDASGNTVTDPTFAFTAKNFSFDAQDFTGVLGTSSQRFRVSNPTATETWGVSIAASSPSDVWSDGTYSFAFNAVSADDGRLTINPSVGTLAGVGGCSTLNISKGSSAYFLSGTTNSIDLLTASLGTALGCRWDFTDAPMTQRLPAAQPPSTYSLGLIVSVL